MNGSVQNTGTATDGQDCSCPPCPVTGVASHRPDPERRSRRWAGDFPAAFADLGTFLPLIIGLFAVHQHDPIASR